MHFRFPLSFAFVTIVTLASLVLPQSLYSSGRGAAPALTRRYRVVDLGAVNDQAVSHPAGLNSRGYVAGRSGAHAALFGRGLFVEGLGTLPGGFVSSAAAINDSDQVVGDSEFQNGGSIRHATLFDHGAVTDLGFLPLNGNYSFGAGVNNFAEVVGYSGPTRTTSNTRAFIWDADRGMRDLGTLGGQWAKAFSINDLGVVTGTSQSAGGAFHAFVWTEAGGMRDIGVLGGSTSTGNYVNLHGHVAGTSNIALDNREHAFIYDGALRDLGSIGSSDLLSDRSSAAGINSSDHVVGTTYRPYEGGALFQIPFIYRDGQMFDLEGLVDSSGADYRLYAATGINDSGEIAVDAIKISANVVRGVLLIPVPTAPTAAVAGRLIRRNGGAIASTTVFFTDDISGTVYATRSNSFGYFRMSAIPTDRRYTISVSSKRYEIAQRTMSVYDDVNGLVLVGRN